MNSLTINHKPSDQEIGGYPEREKTTFKCVRGRSFVWRIIIATIIAIVSGVVLVSTASYILASQQVRIYRHGLYIYCIEHFRTAAACIHKMMVQNNCSVGCCNYTFTTCRGTLSLISGELSHMESNNGAALAVASGADMERNENTVELILYGLDYAAGTNECKSSILSFMCLYLFPPCDDNGTIQRPSAENCYKITNGSCREVLQSIMLLPGLNEQLTMPNCQTLLDSSPMFSVIDTSVLTNDKEDSPSADHRNCSEMFFWNNGTCSPRCDRWNKYSDQAATAVSVIEIASSMATILMGSAILALSCRGERKMYTFPSVLILHFIVFLILDATTTSIGFIVGRTTQLFCSSVSLLEALQNPTALCSAIQALHTYFYLEMSTWWFIHVATLFIQIKYPFRARTCKANGQNKYIYVGMLVTSLVVPVFPLIVVFQSGGYTTRTFSPLVCVEKNAEVAFYSVILPLNIYTVIGTALMILNVALLIKHRLSRQDPNNKIITPDRRILFMLCHYLLFSIAITVVGTLRVRPDEQFVTNVYKYVHCESKGSAMCDREKVAYEELTLPLTDILYHILFGSIPFALLSLVAPVDKVTHMFNSRRQSSPNIQAPGV